MQLTSVGFLYFHIRLLSKNVAYVYKYSGYTVEYTRRRLRYRIQNECLGDDLVFTPSLKHTLSKYLTYI